MGYELHIIRTVNWLEADTNPISRDEWNTYATRHPKLVEDGWVEWLDIGREPCYSFMKNDGIEVSLTWQHGDVRISGPYGTSASW